jgi:hypothetical protein
MVQNETFVESVPTKGPGYGLSPTDAVKSCVFILRKKGLGNISGDSLTNSSGADPTIASYNAGGVKIYNATSSLVRFGNKNLLFYSEKRSSLQTKLALQLST